MISLKNKLSAPQLPTELSKHPDDRKALAFNRTVANLTGKKLSADKGDRMKVMLNLLKQNTPDANRTSVCANRERFAEVRQ